jgi:hypothetical protein
MKKAPGENTGAVSQTEQQTAYRTLNIISTATSTKRLGAASARRGLRTFPCTQFPIRIPHDHR